MELAETLEWRPGQGLDVEGLDAAAAPAPAGVPLDDGADAGLLVVVTDRSALAGRLTDLVAAASADRVTWVAHPTSGQLGTDLHRDELAVLLKAEGVRPVRQVADDDVWSALRFRPA